MAKSKPTTALSLSSDEIAELERCEKIIKKGLSTFHEVGAALATIRDKQLYRVSHKTFEAFCKDTYDLTRPRAYQFIEAAEVVSNLSTIVDKTTEMSHVEDGEKKPESKPPIPKRESQARTLAKAPKEKQPEVWQKAVEKANGKQPTAKQVEETVADVLASLPSKSDIDAKQKAEKAAAQEVLRDSNGSPLTIAAVKAFDQIPLFNELEQHIRNAGKTLEKIMGTPARSRVKEYFAPSEKLKNVQLARALRDLIEDGKPFAVCPTCQGDKHCETCGGGAFITKHQYKQIKQFAEADGLVRR